MRWQLEEKEFDTNTWFRELSLHLSEGRFEACCWFRERKRKLMRVEYIIIITNSINIRRNTSSIFFSMNMVITRIEREWSVTRHQAWLRHGHDIHHCHRHIPLKFGAKQLKGLQKQQNSWTYQLGVGLERPELCLLRLFRKDKYTPG